MTHGRPCFRFALLVVVVFACPACSLVDAAPAATGPLATTTAQSTLSPSTTSLVPTRVAGHAVDRSGLPAAVASVAREFAERFLEYDARHESATAFLSRIDSLSTASVVRRLRNSGRARMSWAPLRARAERTSLTVAGVAGDEPNASVNNDLRVVLNGILTTSSTLGAFRSPIALRLEVTRVGATWRVSHMAGGGS
jgi:hypothetical protein